MFMSFEGFSRCEVLCGRGCLELKSTSVQAKKIADHIDQSEPKDNERETLLKEHHRLSAQCFKYAMVNIELG